MIEPIIIEYLSGALSPVKVTAEEPDNLEGKHVVIEKTGSSITDHIKTSTIAIKSYGDSLYDALVLNEQVKAAMEDFEYDTYRISAVEFDTDYNFSDTAKKRYRYQAVFTLTHY